MRYGAYKELWRKLISPRRFTINGKTIVLDNPGLQEGREPYEADIGRAIFSQPFRRLAGKTQVHPFASVDYIHNRLTHSIEAGHVSRSLGRDVAMFMLKERGDLQSEKEVEIVGWICQVAGLMHDIGNPPYGHAGEDAIRAWAKQNTAKITSLTSKHILNDFLYFDGNAQAFRMACRPDLRETAYFRLTAASLGAMIKYPFNTNSKEAKRGKSAAFSTEEKIYETLKNELGLKNGKRHPLSYITEAADDICYRISDFEDAVLMGLMDEGEVKSLLLDGMSFQEKTKLQEINASLSRIRAVAIGSLIREFAQVFKDCYDDIMCGNFKGDLKSKIGDKWGGVLARIKERYDFIFSDRKKVVYEVGAFGQIANVLDKYLMLLEDMQQNKNPGLKSYDDLTFLSQRLITLAWREKSYYIKNINQDIKWWAHAVLDFVVGMTDEYLHKVATEFL